MTQTTEDKNEALWHQMFATGHPALRSYWSFNRRLPAPPRCKLCLAPFGGWGSVIMAFQNRRPSNRNPRYCSRCDVFLRAFPGGAEVDMAMVFVDVRGSVTLGARLTPKEFSRAMNVFYKEATRVLNETDGFIIDLVGDEVVALYPPGFTGPDYARRAVEAAKLMLGTVIRAPDGSDLAFGLGVHSGLAYIGTMTGDAAGIQDVRAVGDNLNVTARLASQAGPGEALLTEAVCQASGFDPTGLEHRELALKGRDAPLAVRVLCAPTVASA